LKRSVTTEKAAEAETHHNILKFITVIDRCSTVATNSYTPMLDPEV
jgi:hypothetical protein